MGIGESIRDAAKSSINSHGYTVTLYASPVRTLDDEGASTITLGTPISATALFFMDDGAIVNDSFGVNQYNTFRMYLSYDAGTVTPESILKINDEYYKITWLDKHPIGSVTVTYYEIVVEKMQDQTTTRFV